MSRLDGFRVATDQTAGGWDDFVERCSGGSICHLYGWKQVIETSYGHTCYYLYEGVCGSFSGVLPLVLLSHPLSKGKLVSVPYLDMGGSLANSLTARDALRAAALRLAVEIGARAVELRGGGGEIAESATEGAQRYRLVLQLPNDIDSLRQVVGPKVRNQVKKSEKSRLSTRDVGARGLDRFYDIFSQNMRSLGSPVHSRVFFERIFEVFAARARLYLTLDERDQPVAGAVSLSFKGTSVVPWAASLRSARRSCPNHSLYWQILADAVERGDQEFDFGRSWEGSGTFHFKKQWGAEPQRLDWFRWNQQGEQQLQAHLRPQDHRFMTNLWSRLPLPVANWLGSRIRGYLAN